MPVLELLVELSWLILRVERPDSVLELEYHDICGSLEHVAVDSEVEDPALEPRLLVACHLLAAERRELAWLHVQVRLTTSEDEALDAGEDGARLVCVATL